ncbi:hypothetical protein BD413DRAFT_675446 [Trametes elegans]|nr:hypothetical protein BD413DRAFT_675446 [Trametes elegans]
MASSSAPVVRLYQDIFAENSCELAAASMFLYDTLLDLDREIRLVWRLPGNAASLLYLFNRYLTVVQLCLGLSEIAPMSDNRCGRDERRQALPRLTCRGPTSCLTVGWLGLVIERLVLLGPAAFTTLRVWALSGKKKPITGAVLVLSLGPFVVNTSTIYLRHFTNLPPPVLCAPSLNMSTSEYIAGVVASRGSLILADLLAVIVTWRETYETSQRVEEAYSRPSLSKVMLSRGIDYFCSLAILNILDVILTVLGIQSDAASNLNYVTIFLDPISAILVCRFLLDLRGVSKKLAGGSSGTVSSLDFGGVGSQIPPSNPSFLRGSLVGSAHSSPDVDEDEAAPTEHHEMAAAQGTSNSPIV